MFTTAAALAGILLVATLAIGPAVVDALPDRAIDDDLAAAWDHPHTRPEHTAAAEECVLAA